jgi:hypothetical protein
MKTYKNRELSEKLGINFQRWKRLSREFLPPDDIASLPKGMARKFTPNEAFTVYLGTHLIDLGFSIVEAKKIIEDLFPWLTEKMQWVGNLHYMKKGIDQHIKQYTISVIPIKIWPNIPKINWPWSFQDEESKSLETTCEIEEWYKSQKPRFGFNYKIRGYITSERDEYDGYPVMSEKFITYTLDTTLPLVVDGKEIPFNEHHPQKPGPDSTKSEFEIYSEVKDSAKEHYTIDDTKPVKILEITSLGIHFDLLLAQWDDLDLS